MGGRVCVNGGDRVVGDDEVDEIDSEVAAEDVSG